MAQLWIYFIFILIQIATPLNISHARYEFYEEAGDEYIPEIMIGALIPIHSRATNGNCDVEIRRDGIIALEALHFSLTQINRQLRLSPSANFRIGAVTLDDCMSERVGLEKALELVRHQLVSKTYTNNGSNDYLNVDIVGVVGPASSVVAEQVANMFTLFKLPLISYLATTDTLSNRERFPYFLRTVPSDRHQASAMVQLMKQHNWSYVLSIYEDTTYGETAYRQFRTETESRPGVCIGHSLLVKVDDPSSTDIMYYRKKLRHFHKKMPKARVIVMYVTERYAHLIMEAAVAEGLHKEYTWIGSDGWGSRFLPESVRDSALGSYLVIPEFEDWLNFNDHFYDESKTIEERQNPWWSSFKQQLLNKAQIDQPLTTEITVKQEVQRWELAFSHFVFQAVSAFSAALQQIKTELCVDTEHVCPQMRTQITSHKSKFLMQTLQNITYEDINGNMRSFNKRGGTNNPEYTVLNYQLIGEEETNGDSSEYKWTTVGVIKLNSSRGYRATYTQSQDYLSFIENRVTVQSSCSTPCAPGYVERHSTNKCCWTCERCARGTVLHKTRNNGSTCHPCLSQETVLPPFFESNPNRTTCVLVTPTVVGVDDRMIFAMVVLSIGGVIAVTFTAVVFLVYGRTPVVKASGKEVSFVLLFGIFLLYVTVFMVLLPPTTLGCAVTRFIYGTAYTVCYAAIFTKINRIVRIFQLSYDRKGGGVLKARERRVKLINPMSQLLIIAMIVMFQCMLNGVWLILRAPKSDYSKVIDEFTDRLTVYHHCEAFEEGDMLIAFMLPFTLLILTFAYAYKARKIPGRFNETRYVIIATCSTCILWLAFIPIFLATNNNQIPLRVFSLCAAPALNATVMLLCMFAPNVYVVIFRPHKNTKATVMGRKPATNNSIDKEVSQPKESGGSISLKQPKSSMSLNVDEEYESEIKRVLQLRNSSHEKIDEEPSTPTVAVDGQSMPLLPQQHKSLRNNTTTTTCACQTDELFCDMCDHPLAGLVDEIL